MKKLLALLLTTAMTITCLAGCGSKGTTDNTADTAVEESADDSATDTDVEEATEVSDAEEATESMRRLWFPSLTGPVHRQESTGSMRN